MKKIAADMDTPVCRLQFPDGTVPGNTAEAAEGWKREYDAIIHRDILMTNLLSGVATGAPEAIEAARKYVLKEIHRLEAGDA